MIAHAPPRIDEVERRPVQVPARAPDGVVVVAGDPIFDLQLEQSAADVVDVVLKPEFWRVDANHDEPIAVLFGPRAYVWKRAEPVDAGVGPEIDQHHSAGQARHGETRRVEPLPRTV